MASSAAVDSEEDSSVTTPSHLPFTLQDIQHIIDAQTAVFKDKLTEVMLEMSTIKTSIQHLACDVAELKQRTVAVEDSCEVVKEKQDELQSTVEDIEEDMQQLKKDMNQELDKLEAISRRDNLKFFNIPESPDENYESCADKVVNVLQNTVPNKKWNLNDIVRAHRLGARTPTAVSRPRPMIVKMAKWKDKMDIINSGREALRKKGIKVAGDLTTRQKAVLKEHRDRGLHAFYKAGKLVVTGPLRAREDRSRTWNQSGNPEKHGDVSKGKPGRQHDTPHLLDGVDNCSPALMDTSQWPALKTPRGKQSANPSKRPRPPSTPEMELTDPDQMAEEWA